MRRVGLALTAAAMLTFLPASDAFAEDSAATSVCTITDTGVTGLTGLAATGDGYAVVTGARTGASNKSYHVYLLDGSCKKTTALNFSGGGSRDPQDLAVAKDGSIWVADTGDPNGERTSVVMWKVPPDGGTSTLYRMTYPDGAHDAEALLMGSDGLPIIITKGVSGPAQIYQATAALSASASVPLKSVGTFAPQKTNTPTKLGAGGAAAQTVTGAATSPDGKKVTIRTLTDAYEWDVADGNVVPAITSDKYRLTPLPNEPSGSAIAYTADGAKFLTLSNVSDSQTPRTVLAYTPAKPASTGASTGPQNGAGAAGGSGGSTSWFGKLSFTDLTYVIGVIGVIGLLMIVGGILGIKRSRKQQRLAAKRAAAGEDDWGQPAGDGYGRDYDGYEYADPYAAPGQVGVVGGDGAGFYGDGEPDERYPSRSGRRRSEPGTYPGGVYGGAAGDDFDAGYPDSYGAGYGGSSYPAGPNEDYAGSGGRGAEYGSASRRGAPWGDEATDSTSGRVRPGAVPPVPPDVPRQPRSEPRRSGGRTPPPPRPNTWADEHEGFGDLRG